MVLIGELIAMVIVLAQTPYQGLWDDLAVVSLFVQWVGLASSAVLCLARPWLVRLGDLPVAVFSYALIVLVTAALTGVVHLWVLGGEVMHWPPRVATITLPSSRSAGLKSGLQMLTGWFWVMV